MSKKETTSIRSEDTVFGEGPDNADIMLIGQNPGREEVEQGRPFVGRSGKFLEATLKENGLDRENLYITGVVKEPTPHNKKPNAKQIKRWMPYLLEEIADIGPRIIVLMGRVACETPRIPGIRYIETYHPAAAMRFPEIKRKFREDIKKLKEEASRIKKGSEDKSRN